MALFNFSKKKTGSLSAEEIENEYLRALRTVKATDFKNRSLIRDIKGYAERTYIPHKGDDLLDQKAEFMRIYAFRAYQWRCYHTLGYKKGKLNSISFWTQKWHDYEQKTRLQAQKRWREMLSNTR